jgi:hypothetical protein
MTDDRQGGELQRLHVQLGFWCIALFGLVGLLLEALHGFKSGFLLDVGSSTRRHMLTLGHAHGTLLGLVNVGFAWASTLVPAARLGWASRCLLGATVALPIGFLLGGWYASDGDPGIGIVLVPLGAVCLVIGSVLTALGLRRARA